MEGPELFAAVSALKPERSACSMMSQSTREKKIPQSQIRLRPPESYAAVRIRFLKAPRVSNEFRRPEELAAVATCAGEL